MADNEFKVEYAKTGRAACKDTQCKQNIDKGSLRIGKLKANFFDPEGDKLVDWFHAECAFNALTRARGATKRIDSSDDLQGFEDITPEDQQLLESTIKRYVDSGYAKSGGAKRKKASKADADGDDDGDDDAASAAGKSKARAPAAKKPRPDTGASASSSSAKSPPVADAAAAFAQGDARVILSTGTRWWKLCLTGSEITVSFGKQGENGKENSQSWSSPAQAAAEAALMLSLKRKREFGGDDVKEDLIRSTVPRTAASVTAPAARGKDTSAASKPPAAASSTTKSAGAPAAGSSSSSSSSASANVVANLVQETKFWNIKQSGKEVSVHFGKIGTDGQTQSKELSDVDTARKYAQKQIEAKKLKGYVSA